MRPNCLPRFPAISVESTSAALLNAGYRVRGRVREAIGKIRAVRLTASRVLPPLEYRRPQTFVFESNSNAANHANASLGDILVGAQISNGRLFSPAPIACSNRNSCGSGPSVCYGDVRRNPPTGRSALPDLVAFCPPYLYSSLVAYFLAICQPRTPSDFNRGISWLVCDGLRGSAEGIRQTPCGAAASVLLVSQAVALQQNLVVAHVTFLASYFFGRDEGTKP
jgi:hypothetical protein